MVAARPGRPD